MSNTHNTARQANDPQLDVENLILCDEVGAFVRRIVYNEDGTVASTNDFTVDGAPYTVGTIEPCAVAPQDSELAEIVVCADNVTAIRRITTLNGAVTSETFIGANGATIVPTDWQAGPCIVATGVDLEELNVCIAVQVGPNQVSFPAIRRVERAADGTETITFIAGNNGDVTAQVVAWNAGECDNERLIVCSDEGTLIQRHGMATATNTDGIDYFNLDGTPFAGEPTNLRTCDPTAAEELDFAETLWCIGDVPAIRIDVRNEGTGVITTTWVRSDGVEFTPTANEILLATPGVCPIAGLDTDIDTEFHLVCGDGLPMLREVTFNNGVEQSVRFIGTDGVATTPTTWTPGSCAGVAGEELDFAETAWCVDALPAVRIDVRNEATGIVTTTWTRADGTVFVPTAAQLTAATVGACSSVTTDLEEEGWCIYRGANGSSTSPGVRRSIYNTATQITTVTWHSVDGVLLAPQPTAAEIALSTPGNCTGSNFKSRHANVVPGTAWNQSTLPANERYHSVTVTVITGEAVVAAEGVSVTYPAGFTASWSADGSKSVLIPPTTVTAVGANARTIVHYTARWPVA